MSPEVKIEVPTERDTITIPKWFVWLFPVLFVIPGMWAWRVDRALFRIELAQAEMVEMKLVQRSNGLRLASLEQFDKTLGGPHDPLYAFVKEVEGDLNSFRNTVYSSEKFAPITEALPRGR